MDLFYSLPINILHKINFLVQDFVGFSIDFYVFRIFAFSILFAAFLIFLSYSFGKKIFALFNYKTQRSYDYLFFVSLGYVLIGNGIAVLGFFFALNTIFISAYLLLIVFFSLLLPYSLNRNYHDLLLCVKNDLTHIKKSKFVFIWTGLFIFIAILNLINPEIREDQYHVDLPIMYLQNQTIMVEPRELIGVSASPLLSEMFYVPGILLLGKESARYIHFVFYILVILVLINFSKLKNYMFATYTPLLFASAPIVIHETSSMYVDFQWIFLFLLSILILIDRKNNKSFLAKAGFLFGGVVATKLWTIVFSVTYSVYLLTNKENARRKILNVAIFILFVLIVSGIWFLRAYILTGNPLYPAFNNISSGTSFFTSLFNFVGINYQLIDILSFVNVFSPLFFVGLLLLIFRIRANIKILFKLKLFRFLFFLLILYLSIHYPFGRYLLGLYIVFIFLSSMTINDVYKFKSFKIVLNSILILLFLYYFLSSVFVLPYAFGVADKNTHLSRILVRDNSSYYDFGRKFDKNISPADKVAMYNFHGYYYANFKYSDVQFIYDENQKSINLLKQKGYTKLITRTGDIKWFCNEMNLADCDSSDFKLISRYSEFPTYYLYNINYD